MWPERPRDVAPERPRDVAPERTRDVGPERPREKLTFFTLGVPLPIKLSRDGSLLSTQTDNPLYQRHCYSGPGTSPATTPTLRTAFFVEKLGPIEISSPITGNLKNGWVFPPRTGFRLSLTRSCQFAEHLAVPVIVACEG